MRCLLALPLLAAGIAGSLPAAAQTIEGRVDRLEREVRAIQRRVFPGGAPNQVEPQITAPPAQVAIPGSPAAGPLASLTARLEAIESQQTQLTGQIEQAQFRIRQLEEAFNAYRRTTDERLRADEASGAAAAPADPAVSPADPAEVRASGDTARGPARGGGTLGGTRAPAAASGAAASARPRDPARANAVGAIERPSTGDAAEDAYVYGFRLWQAKLYPEAQAELKNVVAQHPRHRRASWAQNLLGRAYLDEGKPSLASIAFYENYKKMPDGERAPDSLFYLAQSLVELKKNKEACDVYGELTDVYGDRINAQMKADVARGRAAARCAA